MTLCCWMEDDTFGLLGDKYKMIVEAKHTGSFDSSPLNCDFLKELRLVLKVWEKCLNLVLARSTS